MPSFDHEILVDLFRESGPLASELLGQIRRDRHRTQPRRALVDR